MCGIVAGDSDCIQSPAFTHIGIRYLYEALPATTLPAAQRLVDLTEFGQFPVPLYPAAVSAPEHERPHVIRDLVRFPDHILARVSVGVRVARGSECSPSMKTLPHRFSKGSFKGLRVLECNTGSDAPSATVVVAE